MNKIFEEFPHTSLKRKYINDKIHEYNVKKDNGNLNFCIKTNGDLNSITNFILILLKISFLIKNLKKMTRTINFYIY